MRSDLPTGTVTFLFTDVEGSTRLLHELGPERYADALAAHRRIVREACTARGGVEVDTQGDAFFFAFPSAPGAVAAARAITEALARAPIHVRIGLHSGTPFLTDEGYVGDDIHVAARIAASGHGGQVVLSNATRELIDGFLLTDLGEHRLKDIAEPVPVFQVGTAPFPPLKTISNTNLPRPASSFVGRERELADVLASIEQGTRLLTLTGPGGSGKTRLAIEAAAALVPSYKAGVFWVGLAGLRESSLVTETIAQTFGAEDGLAERIGQREMLLLLDNLEQVIGAAPDLSALLQACPNLTLLCTSRELLRIQGEVEYRVPPLASSEAVALFCERSGLEASAEIVELCARLDDLPLAVELAAARTKALSPRQILERLSSRLDLLKSGRDVDARQQTLRATIAWSYELLSDEEQRVFRALSVFAGGCTLEAAEHVAAADLDALQSLVERSLLRFTDERYWMLETIRDFAGEKRAVTDSTDDVLGRHLDYFSALAVGVAMRGDVDEYDFGRIDDERENLRFALGTALQRDPDRGLELAGALGGYWTQRGDFREGRERLARALAGAPGASDLVRARALRWSGALAHKQTDFESAQRFGSEALRLYQAAGDRRGAGFALNLLGIIAMYRNELLEAQRFFEASLEEHQAAGGEAGRLVGLSNLASIAISLGDNARAIILAREIISAARGRDEHAVAHAANTIGLALEAEGETEQARRAFEECLAISRAHNFVEAEAYGLASLAHVELPASPSEAAGHYEESIALMVRLEDPRGIAYCLEGLAAVAIAFEDAVRAATLLGAAAAIRDRTGAPLDALEQAEVDAASTRAKAALGDASFASAFSRGSALDVDAVDIALSEPAAG